MITIEEAHELLDEVAQELPEEFWNELNGGVSLLPDLKRSPDAVADDLFVLGEYCVHPVMGRYINIYYGSFQRIYGECSAEAMRRHLRKTLFHEFTHHVESLAGERGLEIKDENRMHAYLASHAGEEYDAAEGADEEGAYDVRPADRADLPGVLALYEDFFAQESELQPAYVAAAKQDADFLRQVIDSETDELFVAADDGGVFGFVLVQSMRTPEFSCIVPHEYAYVMDVYVAPEERGQGVGSELIAVVRDWAAERGLDYLELNVLENNERARRFYEKNGFGSVVRTLRAPLSAAGNRRRFS